MDSIINNAYSPEQIEFLIYIDNDDTVSAGALDKYKYFNINIYTGIRMGGLMEIQNFLYRKSTGDIIGYLADDVVFLTPSWDVEVRKSFPKDMIALVCPSEIHKGFRKAPHGFVSRKSVEIVGDFVPKYFVSIFSDQWMCEVYTSLGRFVELHSVKIDHQHPGFARKKQYKKLSAYMDDVYAEKNTRRKKDRDKRCFQTYAKERDEWVKKLKSHLETCYDQRISEEF